MLGTPETAFLTSGTGSTGSRLASFDAALIDAGVGDANLIPVSSVIPPDCSIVEPTEVGDGELLPCVLAKHVGEGSLEAAVAAALSDDIGMVAESTGPGAGERAAGEAEEMLETRGLEAKETLVESAETEAEEVGAAVAVLAFGTDF